MEPGVSTNPAPQSPGVKALCQIVFDQKIPVNASLGAISDGHVYLAQPRLNQRLTGRSSRGECRAKGSRLNRNETRSVSRSLENWRTPGQQAGSATPGLQYRESRGHSDAEPGLSKSSDPIQHPKRGDYVPLQAVP